MRNKRKKKIKSFFNKKKRKKKMTNEMKISRKNKERFIENV